MNLVFSFDSILSALALTRVFPVMALAIILSGLMMIFLADHVAEFLKKNSTWLAGAVPGDLGNRLVGPGTMLPFRGRQMEVRQGTALRGAAQIAGGCLHVPGRSEDLPRRVAAFLKLRFIRALSASQ